MTARKAQPQKPPQQVLEPDAVAEFLNRLREINVAARHEHERIRKQIDMLDRDTARERDRLDRDYERAVEELNRTTTHRRADLTESATKQADIIARCSLAIEIDTPRQAPALSERGQE